MIKENNNENAKTIYCPKCGRRVMFYDGKGTIPIDAGCRKCRKRVVYFPDRDVAEIKNIPERPASGTRIWF